MQKPQDCKMASGKSACARTSRCTTCLRLRLVNYLIPVQKDRVSETPHIQNTHPERRTLASKSSKGGIDLQTLSSHHNIERASLPLVFIITVPSLSDEDMDTL